MSAQVADGMASCSVILNDIAEDDGDRSSPSLYHMMVGRGTPCTLHDRVSGSPSRTVSGLEMLGVEIGSAVMIHVSHFSSAQVADHTFNC